MFYIRNNNIIINRVRARYTILYYIMRDCFRRVLYNNNNNTICGECGNVAKDMSRSLRTYAHDDDQDYTKTEKVRDLGPESCRTGCDRNNIEPESVPFKFLSLSPKRLMEGTV